MSKKFIALSLAIVMIAVMFTACSAKLRIEKIQGKEYAVLTDENGKVVVDGSNRVYAIVTDSDGEVVTYENGEPQTYLVPISNYFVADGTLYTPVYTLSETKGWAFSTSGILEKDKTDGKCKISIALVLEKDYEKATLEEYLKVRDERNAQVKPLYEAEGYKVEVEKKDITITSKNVPAVYYREAIYNADGSFANYSETVYIQVGEYNKYSIHYVSEAGEGYDEKFDFIDYLNNNFTLR